MEHIEYTQSELDFIERICKACKYYPCPCGGVMPGSFPCLRYKSVREFFEKAEVEKERLSAEP